MDVISFKKSLQQSLPPQGISLYLLSLWYDGKNDWENAHTIIQDSEDSTGSWVHAYLHRKEGDLLNADYWYKRAGKERPATSLEDEWEKITKALLQIENEPGTHV